MQNECYTPMKGTQKSDLGNLERTIKLIKKAKPNLITLSEAEPKDQGGQLPDFCMLEVWTATGTVPRVSDGRGGLVS